jgi:hypothetical protein
LDYYSGHKKAYGLNTQAVCDARLRFLFFSCRCPGKTNDLNADRHSKVSTQIDNLPDGFYTVGDAVYENSDHLLTPFSGQDLQARKNNFNFYLSQLRIRIEMAFGRLVSQWGILWRNLRIRLERQPALFACLAKLHIFLIDNNESVLSTDHNGNPLPPLAHQNTDGTVVMKEHWQAEFKRCRVVNSDVREALEDMLFQHIIAREN